MTGTHNDPEAQPPAPIKSESFTEYPAEMNRLLASNQGLPPRTHPELIDDDFAPTPPQPEMKPLRDRESE